MNNIFYEFLEKNNLQDVILDIPINENFNLPFVPKDSLQPLRIDLVMYPVKINNVIYNCYISSVPKPILYFTLKKSKAILDITTQEQILQALVSVVNKTLVKDKDYIIVKSPKTLPPTGKGSIVGDAISWKKGVWQFIRMAIEKGSRTNVQSNVKIDIKTSASAGSTGSTTSSDSSNGQFDAKVIKVFEDKKIIGFEVLSDKISVGDIIEITKDGKKITDTIKSIQINKISVDSANKGITCGVKLENDSKLLEGDLIKIKKESNNVTQNTTDSATQANSNDVNQSSSKTLEDKQNEKLKSINSTENTTIRQFIDSIDYSRLPELKEKFESHFDEIKKQKMSNFHKFMNPRELVGDKLSPTDFIKSANNVKKILDIPNTWKTLNDFLQDQKVIDRYDYKKDSVVWFYENYVNNHFTMKRIFNS